MSGVAGKEAAMRFDDRSVLITGGARGIGFAAATAFLSEGAQVTIAARTTSRLEEARELLGGPERVATVEADVATVDGCNRAVEAALSAFAGIDVVVTCAGNYETAPIQEVTEDLWDRTMAVHLKGTFFTVKAALPALREKHGVVVTIASDAGILGIRGGWAAYCAAKGGIVNLTRSLALDLAPDVRVNSVAPGPVGTEHLYADLEAARYGGFEAASDPIEALAATVPLGRIILPEEVADAILFAASAPSMTGAILSLDGGTTIAIPSGDE
jgi:NAD(P)-dependent dehydrogenase (short-subunit alcohol dehydrogenase family)